MWQLIDNSDGERRGWLTIMKDGLRVADAFPYSPQATPEFVREQAQRIVDAMNDIDMKEHGAVTVTLLPRDDGGIRVCSKTNPGLILSGAEPEKVLAQVWPALKALGEHNVFRRLSPEPAPHELGIPEDASEALTLRTASEIESDRIKQRG